MNNEKKYQLVVIGGGSAGIAAAISAKKNGLNEILIIEKEQFLGGILLQCIHNGFGLTRFKEELTGPEYAQREIEQLEKANISYVTSSLVTNVVKKDDDFYITYTNPQQGIVTVIAKTIIAATGCIERTAGAIGLAGDRPQGVMTAGLAQRYINIDGYMVGKKALILGSGDIGLIMARRLVLEGAEVLGVVEIMPYSNGLNRNIVQCLEDYNIPLYLSHTVKKVIGKERLEKVIIASVDENREFIEGTEIEFNVDTLLLSVGLIPTNPLLELLGVTIDPKTKGPIVDDSLQTSIPGIFACGNSLHVHDLVDFVSAEATVAGKSSANFVLNNNTINYDIFLEAGPNISYVIPNYASKINDDDLTIKFRVKKPFNKCIIKITNNNELLKTIKKQYLLPAEMEIITLSKKIIENGKVIIEVQNDE